ncbi:MAG: replication initiation negative regulator SeqA [Endomicrobia bacterium]|nr:replication initiation negative regulator SeqA [Endomicrobiia bacterium]
MVKFKNKGIKVKTWIDLLIKISTEILKESNDFSAATKIKGRKRAYFSTDGNKLFRPVKIENTNYFCESNLSAKNIVTITKELIKTFGYNPKNLEIVYK